MIYLQIFWVFLKIGLSGFGGGYAMLPLFRQEVVVHRGWVSAAEFAVCLAALIGAAAIEGGICAAARR
jgi:chromate transporter